MFHGGKVIAGGGKIYADFIDIKQPLIYYLFALSNLLFGNSEIAPRLLDYLVQLSTAIITFFVVRKLSGKSIIAYISSLIYLIVYISLNYSNTAQCESFSAIILILLIYLFSKDKIKLTDYFSSGVLIGILGGLKVTFLIILFTLPLIITKNDLQTSSKPIINLFSLLFGLILFFFLTHLPLTDSLIYSGFKDALTFLTFYSNFPPLDTDFIRESLKKTAMFFGDNFSILLFFSTIWGIKLHLTNDIELKSKKLLNVSILFTIFLLISVVIERKMMVYHFSRFLLPISIVGSFGLYSFYQIIIIKFKSKNSISKFIVTILVLFFLLFSPIPRYFNMLAMSYNYFFNQAGYNQMFSDENSASNNRIEQLEVINHLRRTKKEDLVLVINSGGNIINHKISSRLTSFGHSCFYLSVLKIDKWRKKFFDELNTADWLIIQKNDIYYFMTRTNFSSFELIMKDENLSSVIRNKFEIYSDLKNFIILRSKQKTE